MNGRALPDGAFHGPLSTVHFHDLPHMEESDACAHLPGHLRAVGALVQFKNALMVLRCDPRAGILHGDPCRIGTVACVDARNRGGDPPAVRGELERVRQQVLHGHGDLGAIELRDRIARCGHE